jgi:hypothetical protein
LLPVATTAAHLDDDPFRLHVLRHTIVVIEALAMQDTCVTADASDACVTDDIVEVLSTCDSGSSVLHFCSSLQV